MRKRENSYLNEERPQILAIVLSQQFHTAYVLTMQGQQHSIHVAHSSRRPLDHRLMIMGIKAVLEHTVVRATLYKFYSLKFLLQ